MFETKPMAAIKPAWKSSTKIFEPYSVTYVSPQPSDRFNFVALVVLMQAMAMFLPTNMFINSETFFRDFKLDNVIKGNNNTNYNTTETSRLGFYSKNHIKYCNTSGGHKSDCNSCDY
ncbi:unnamed protein product [Oppiella nova]|uniref:Uncharacterized protein n=1 Tax=Oppiella nova TaxID=334625 RepID=A0A7R9QR73_9ACAR|nr:unnamed protein product [Oppiella nova]CAG2170899.1 unnamed protein product [Oppiella nova]